MLKTLRSGSQKKTVGRWCLHLAKEVSAVLKRSPKSHPVRGNPCRPNILYGLFREDEVLCLLKEAAGGTHCASNVCLFGWRSEEGWRRGWSRVAKKRGEGRFLNFFVLPSEKSLRQGNTRDALIDCQRAALGARAASQPHLAYLIFSKKKNFHSSQNKPRNKLPSICIEERDGPVHL